MPVTLAVLNQAGGTGKTTTAVHIAAAAAESGHRVLLVDLDEQANATSWLGAKAGDVDVLSVFLKEATVEQATVPSIVPGVDVLPATDELSGLERALGGKPGAERRLRTALGKTEPRDLVILDCPPGLGLRSVSALAAATDVLVPVVPGAKELEAVGRLADTVEEAAEELNPDLTIGHILVCAADLRQRLDLDVIAALREAYPTQTMHTVITKSVRVRESYAHSQPVTVFDPHGKAADQYRQAAAELLGRLT